MVLILPEFVCRGGEGADVSGLVASIKCALNAEASLETKNLTFRILGTCVVIEGTVDQPGDAARVQQLAERLGSADRVVVRISCPRLIRAG